MTRSEAPIHVRVDEVVPTSFGSPTIDRTGNTDVDRWSAIAIDDRRPLTEAGTSRVLVTAGPDRRCVAVPLACAAARATAFCDNGPPRA